MDGFKQKNQEVKRTRSSNSGFSSSQTGIPIFGTATPKRRYVNIFELPRIVTNSKTPTPMTPSACSRFRVFGFSAKRTYRFR